MLRHLEPISKFSSILKRAELNAMGRSDLDDHSNAKEIVMFSDS